MTEAQTKTFPSNFQLRHAQILFSTLVFLFTASVCIRATTPRETKEQAACGVSMREGEFPAVPVPWGHHEHSGKMPHGLRGGQGGTELVLWSLE